MCIGIGKTQVNKLTTEALDSTQNSKQQAGNLRVPFHMGVFDLFNHGTFWSCVYPFVRDDKNTQLDFPRQKSLGCHFVRPRLDKKPPAVCWAAHSTSGQMRPSVVLRLKQLHQAGAPEPTASKKPRAA